MELKWLKELMELKTLVLLLHFLTLNTQLSARLRRFALRRTLNSQHSTLNSQQICGCYSHFFPLPFLGFMTL